MVALKQSFKILPGSPEPEFSALFLQSLINLFIMKWGREVCDLNWIQQAMRSWTRVISASLQVGLNYRNFLITICCLIVMTGCVGLCLWEHCSQNLEEFRLNWNILFNFGEKKKLVLFILNYICSKLLKKQSAYSNYKWTMDIVTMISIFSSSSHPNFSFFNFPIIHFHNLYENTLTQL